MHILPSVPSLRQPVPQTFKPSPTSRPPQRKNERFHQTLFRYLDKQRLAANLAQLQV